MKRIQYLKTLIVLIAGGLFTNSCSDIFDTKSPSSLDDSNIFSIYDLASGTINNIYTYYGEQNYRARYLPWYGSNSDIEWYNSSEKGDDKAHIASYNALPTNGQMNIANAAEPWSDIYKGIEKANLAIQGLDAYADLTDLNMAQLYGEALTLRAMAYVDLINAWGDVPARFEPISLETMYLPREDRDIIYKRIIADLQTAETMVAWPNELTATSTVERINRAFVKGLLARVCLQASGSALRSDGTVRTSNDPELAKSVLYPIALQACKDVMDQEGKYVALENSFENIFKKLCQDEIAVGGESLWEIPYANSPAPRGRQISTFGIKHNAIDQFVGKAQGGQVGPTPNLFFDYSVKDTRRDVTCIPYMWDKNPGIQKLSDLKTWYFGKFRYEWMDRNISSDDDGINKQYMRYADVVLMRAELENELNGVNAAAPYLKKIRERAFAAEDWTVEVNQYVTAASASKETMFKAIVTERALEFAGEMIRKADLIRWGVLKSQLNETKSKMYRLRALTDEYSDLNPYIYYNMVDYQWKRAGASYNETNAALHIYGLNHGETEDKSSSYEYVSQDSKGVKSRWISESALSDEKIETIYVRDPEKYMYWPIFQYNLDANPLLENYSWY